MLTDLIIIGAGGSSREIAGVIVDINRIHERWNLRGFLDDDPSKLGCAIDSLPVLGPIESAIQYPRASFLIGVASHKNPSPRKRIVDRIRLQPEKFATVVHPSASVSTQVTLGHGTAVLQNVVVAPGAVIGDHVLLSHGVQVGHDAQLGNYVVIAQRATITGGVIVEDSAYIGASAVVAPNVVIGHESLVGIGSTVIANVPAGWTVFGNPARTINLNDERLRR